jgi:hypothetical protein
MTTTTTMPPQLSKHKCKKSSFLSAISHNPLPPATAMLSKPSLNLGVGKKLKYLDDTPFLEMSDLPDSEPEDEINAMFAAKSHIEDILKEADDFAYKLDKLAETIDTPTVKELFDSQCN